MDTGDCVCADCGLVLEQIYLPAYKHTQHSSRMVSYEEEFTGLGYVERFLSDISHNANIPVCIITQTLHRFNDIKQQLHDLKCKFKDREMAAFALYDVLNTENIPRTILEIEICTQISCSVLWKIERALPNTCVGGTTATDLVERYCTCLEINYVRMCNIREIVSNMYGMGNVQPQCLVAIAIHLYLLHEIEQFKRKSKKYPPAKYFMQRYRNEKPTLKQIAKVCRITQATVLKHIKNMHPKQMKEIIKYSLSMPHESGKLKNKSGWKPARLVINRQLHTTTNHSIVPQK